jgi:hypothetical protein
MKEGKYPSPLKKKKEKEKEKESRGFSHVYT